jgi:hypothetical protein
VKPQLLSTVRFHGVVFRQEQDVFIAWYLVKHRDNLLLLSSSQVSSRIWNRVLNITLACRIYRHLTDGGRWMWSIGKTMAGNGKLKYSERSVSQCHSCSWRNLPWLTATLVHDNLPGFPATLIHDRTYVDFLPLLFVTKPTCTSGDSTVRSWHLVAWDMTRD